MKHVAKVAALECCSLVVAPLFAEITTGWIQTGAGPYDYNDTANWANGNINGVFSSDLTLTAAQTITFGRDTELPDGLTFNHAGAYKITMKSADANTYTLTLGGDIVNNASDAKGYVEPEATLNIDLGGTSRTISTTKAITLIHGVISNGAIVTAGAGELRFYGANIYTGGTYLSSSGPVGFINATAFGTGTVRFCDGATLTNTKGIQMTANNPLVFEGNLTYSAKYNVSLGSGPITINKPCTFAINNGYTLGLGGQIDENSPYDITAITKTGGGSLSSASTIVLSDGEEKTLNVSGGQFYFSGSITGNGKFIKAGGGSLELSGASNPFEGTFIIAAGSVRHKYQRSLPSNAKFLILGNGVLRSNTSQDGGYRTAASLLPLVDTASTGILGISSNESGDMDLTNYPGLRIASNGGDFTYSGSITAPSTGIVTIGSGGKLTFGGTITGATLIDVSAANVAFNASQPDFDGEIVATNRSYSVTLGDGVTMPNASIEKTGGSLVLSAGMTGDFTVFSSVRLNAAQLKLNSPSSGAVTQRIGTLTIGTDCIHPSGGTAQVNLANDKDYDSVLRVGSLAFENGAELLHVVNTATGEGTARMFVTDGLQMEGSGALNTIYAQVLPNVRANSEISTYDPDVGIRSLNENEFTLYEAGYSGPVKNNGENAKLVGAGSVLFTENGSVNSLWAVNDSSGNLVVSSAEGVTVGVGSGAIVVNSYSNEKYVNLAMRLDFGSKRGYFFGRSNVFYNLTGAIAGSSGLTICDGNTTTSANGPNLYATNTYHGATYITCLVYPKTADFLANGTARPGNLCLTGTLSFGSNAYARMNGLDGYGSITSNNKDGWIQLGCDNSDGNYRGGFVNNASGANFTFTKLGTGHQRMETKIGEKWSINITGTLQVDGAVAIDRSGYEIYVNDGGVLAGEGTFKGYSKTVVKSGGIIAPGSPEVPNVPMTFTKTLEIQTGASMKFYIGADRASQAIVADGYGITGTAETIPVTVDCTVKKKGSWLLLEADTFNDKAFVFTTKPAGGRLVVKIDETTNRAQLWYEQTSGLYMAIR